MLKARISLSPREHLLRINDILDRVDRIVFSEKYLQVIEASNKSSHEIELISTMILDSIQYCLLVIGEAVKALDPQMKLQMAHVPWHEIVGLRNALAHRYFNTDSEMIKSIINLPLMQLREVCFAQRELFHD